MSDVRWSVSSAVRLMAAGMLLLGLALAHWVSPLGLVLAAFVGLNLTQFSFSGMCPAAWVFERLGLAKEDASVPGEVSRRAGRLVGLAVLAALALYPATGALGPTTVLVALLAASIGQSAFTGWCPAIAWARSSASPSRPA